MTSTTGIAPLTWHRAISSGLYATTAEHRYYAQRETGLDTWEVRVFAIADVCGVPVTSTLIARDGAHPTQALAKAVAAAYEADVDADTKPSQNRMTRAIGAAYDEAFGA